MSNLNCTWWRRGENADDLFGFKKRKDRDAYDKGQDGPFLRVALVNGKTVDEVRQELFEEEMMDCYQYGTKP